MSIKLPKLALEIRLRGIGFFVWDVSAVVHGGPKETVGTDYIKQSANHLLARTSGLTGPSARRLKVLNDGSPISSPKGLERVRLFRPYPKGRKPHQDSVRAPYRVGR